MGKGKGRDGGQLAREQYIDRELAAGRTLGQQRFFSIRDFTLIEHRKGYTVASYRLIEGTTARHRRPRPGCGRSTKW